MKGILTILISVPTALSSPPPGSSSSFSHPQTQLLSCSSKQGSMLEGLRGICANIWVIVKSLEVRVRTGGGLGLLNSGAGEEQGMEMDSCQKVQVPSCTGLDCSCQSPAQSTPKLSRTSPVALRGAGNVGHVLIPLPSVPSSRAACVSCPAGWWHRQCQPGHTQQQPCPAAGPGPARVHWDTISVPRQVNTRGECPGSLSWAQPLLAPRADPSLQHPRSCRDCALCCASCCWLQVTVGQLRAGQQHCPAVPWCHRTGLELGRLSWRHHLASKGKDNCMM